MWIFHEFQNFKNYFICCLIMKIHPALQSPLYLPANHHKIIKWTNRQWTLAPAAKNEAVVNIKTLKFGWLMCNFWNLLSFIIFWVIILRVVMAVRLRFASHYCMSSPWRHTDFRSVDIKAPSTINFSFHLNTMVSDKIIGWHVSKRGDSKHSGFKHLYQG